MEGNEFNNDHFSYLSENLLGEKSKNVILMGDFNVDLLKYKNSSNTANFLDLVYSSSLVPQITTPTWVWDQMPSLIMSLLLTKLKTLSLETYLQESLAIWHNLYCAQ